MKQRYLRRSKFAALRIEAPTCAPGGTCRQTREDELWDRNALARPVVVQPPQGGGGGFCEEELARVCVPSFLLKPAKIVLGFNNYQVDNFLRRLLFFFSVKKANPVFITASLGNATFSQSEREVCSSLRYLQYCKTSIVTSFRPSRTIISFSAAIGADWPLDINCQHQRRGDKIEGNEV